MAASSVASPALRSPLMWTRNARRPRSVRTPKSPRAKRRRHLACERGVI
eukprot:gene15045-19917_t